jgi:hypothetical protein
MRRRCRSEVTIDGRKYQCQYKTKNGKRKCGTFHGFSERGIEHGREICIHVTWYDTVLTVKK